MILKVFIAACLMLAGFCTGSIYSEKKPVQIKTAKSSIKVEYYLEVSEDSIWIENASSHRVYGGKYSQLDSLINVDNQ